MRRRVPNLMAVVVATFALASGCDSSSDPSGSAATTCCLATAVTTEANVIEAAAVDAFGDEYAGLGLVDDEVVVFTAGTVPEGLPDELEGVPVRTVQFTLAELDAFNARLKAVADDMIAEGVRLVSWGVDPATNSISVGVASDPREAEEALASLVGEDLPITVRAEAPVST